MVLTQWSDQVQAERSSTPLALTQQAGPFWLYCFIGHVCSHKGFVNSSRKQMQYWHIMSSARTTPQADQSCPATGFFPNYFLANGTLPPWQSLQPPAAYQQLLSSEAIMKGLELQDNRAGCNHNDMAQKSMKFIRTEYRPYSLYLFLVSIYAPSVGTEWFVYNLCLR